jgi:hypothetical protein
MTEGPTAEDTRLRVSILVAQYNVVSSHHTHFMGLIWQVPALAVAISGVLVVNGLRPDVPQFARTVLMLLGAIFMLVMTVALERYRMFQLRRRSDLGEIEQELVPYGALKLTWDGQQIVNEIRRGQFTVRGLPAYRFEGFKWLRGMMYFVALILLVLFIMTLLSWLGVLPFGLI